MTQGFLFLPDSGGRVKWMDGEPGFWKSMLGIGAKSSEMLSRRCTSCGFVEFYVDTAAQPVKTLRTIDEENERLRNLVTRLQERVGTLEEIATDPAERTAREIEALRSLPDPGDDRTGRDD
ncbi:hypothetical protein [Qipengyuania sp. JC766]|uniref:hypothetical protein n=1 Tax=Qipengyuania sp. JC766 TaxID=3232139 RepID=UPI003457E8CD